MIGSCEGISDIVVTGWVQRETVGGKHSYAVWQSASLSFLASSPLVSSSLLSNCTVFPAMDNHRSTSPSDSGAQRNTKQAKLTTSSFVDLVSVKLWGFLMSIREGLGSSWFGADHTSSSTKLLNAVLFGLFGPFGTQWIKLWLGFVSNSNWV